MNVPLATRLQLLLAKCYFLVVVAFDYSLALLDSECPVSLLPFSSLCLQSQHLQSFHLSLSRTVTASTGELATPVTQCVRETETEIIKVLLHFHFDKETHYSHIVVVCESQYIHQTLER